MKLYVYGYLNRIPSSRRLEREAGRNVEVMWLTARLSPGHKTMAEFRRQNGSATGQVCARFVALCREMSLLTGTRVRRKTVEHPFGTVKARMGATPFLTRTLPRVSAEMALQVMAYNLTRVLNIMGSGRLLTAIAG